jgi:hypothetical protein
MEPRLIYVAKGFQQVSASRRERGPRYRGTPTGIDLMKVVESGVTPIMDIGIAGRNGGQIGAGLVRAHIGCFERAAAAYKGRYQG